MPASVCCAYDCSVCYVQCEASPERLAAPGTAGGSHPSVTLALPGEGQHWTDASGGIDGGLDLVVDGQRLSDVVLLVVCLLLNVPAVC